MILPSFDLLPAAAASSTSRLGRGLLGGLAATQHALLSYFSRHPPWGTTVGGAFHFATYSSTPRKNFFAKLVPLNPCSPATGYQLQGTQH